MIWNSPTTQPAVPPDGYDITLTNSLSLAYSAASTGGNYAAKFLQTSRGTTLNITNGTPAAKYGNEAQGAIAITGAR